MVLILQTEVKTSSHIGVLVDQFLIYCEQSRGMSNSTIKTRKTHLNQFARYCFEQGVFDVSKLSPAFVDDYFAYYQTTHSKNTANTGRRILKVFLKWISGYKELQTLKPETIQLVRTPKALPTALDIEVVRNVISKSRHPQDGLIIAFMVESGVRISEVVTIRVEDVNYDTIKIHGKGSVERTVYVSNALAVKLENFIRNNARQPFDFLFQNTYKGYGKRMTLGTARLRVQKCFAFYGVEMHPHQLRHTFAISLLEKGCDIVTIQKLLGHTDIQTTMVYLRVTDTFLKTAYKKYTI